jgi:hypothetical protein
MLRLSDARNFGRTLTGLCLIGAPVALTAAAAIGPDYFDDDKQQMLQKIGVHPNRYVVALLLFLAAAVLLIAAGIGLVRFFRGAGVTLGQAAGGLLAVGAAATIGFFTIGAVQYEMTRHNLDRAEMADLVEQVEESAMLLPIVILFLVGIAIGSLLLAIAAWRRRLIPVWAALAIVAAAVLGFFGQDNKALEIVGFAILIVGLGTLGLRFLRMTDDEWDAGDAASGEGAPPAPPPMATPA